MGVPKSRRKRTGRTRGAKGRFTGKQGGRRKRGR